MRVELSFFTTNWVHKTNRPEDIILKIFRENNLEFKQFVSSIKFSGTGHEILASLNQAHEALSLHSHSVVFYVSMISEQKTDHTNKASDEGNNLWASFNKE